MHVAILDDRLALDSRIEFRAGTSALDRHSFPLLQQLAAVLKDHPELRIEVRAHTDSSLPDAKARTLSQERAETVVKFLGGHGVDSVRLRATGLGATEPIAPNLTAQGRKKNERIELMLARVAADRLRGARGRYWRTVCCLGNASVIVIVLHF